MITIKKRLNDYPFAHRQHTHDGHCKLIHGHNWDFELTFACTEFDENGFVYDFGKLGWLKELLENNFDHTLVLSEDDPHIDHFHKILASDCPDIFADIKVLPSCSCEGIARWVYETFNPIIEARTENRVWLTRVTVYEDRKNSATYIGGKDNE